MIQRTQFPSILAPYCVACETSAGAVVFRVLPDDTRQFLLLRYRAGHWEFPRGHMEVGETETETALREVREETGLTDVAIVSGVRATMRFSYVARDEEYRRRKKDRVCAVVCKRVIFLAGEVSAHARVRLSHEHSDYLWADYRLAMDTLTFRNARRVLSRIAADLHRSRAVA